MPVTLYTTYSKSKDAPPLAHDTSGLVRFAEIQSISAFISPHEDARLLCGRSTIFIKEKKAWVPWLWEATGYRLPQGSYYWNALILHTDGEENGDFNEDRLNHVKAIDQADGDLPRIEKIALFIIECLVAFRIRNKELIKDGMEPAKWGYTESMAPEPHPYRQCPICMLPAPTS